MKRRFPPNLVFHQSLALTNCDRSDIIGRGRHRTVVMAREAIAGSMRELAQPYLSFPEIAVYFGRSHHSAVFDCYKRYMTWVPCLRALWLDAVRDACESPVDKLEPVLCFTPPWGMVGDRALPIGDTDD